MNWLSSNFKNLKDCLSGRRTTIGQIFSFAVVGTIGFFVNALVLLIATQVVGPIFGQVIAFPPAVMATWWLNRNFTFSSMRPWRSELLRYVSANFLGWLVQNGCYAALVLASALIYEHPVIALVVGSLAGMTFNFVSSKWLVFREPNSASKLE